MSEPIETTLRGPQAFALAREAMTAMEAAGVWPTPLNYELWLHYLADPDGALGAEIAAVLASDEAFTEEVSERLAHDHLPRARLTEEIRDAGLTLNRELTSVAEAILEAQRSQSEYGATLANASEGMSAVSAPAELKQLVAGLASATSKAREENAALEKRLEGSTLEVARLREHLEQVRRDSMTDALTNLANRKAFDEAMERAFSEADGPLTVAVLDVDHFKAFNDTWGHQTGDQVLRYVGSVISRMAKEPRTAARYGGEEFAVIFPGEAAHVAERTLEAVRVEIASRALRRRSTNEDLGAVTVSIGLAERRGDECAQTVLERADAALYASKRGGRDRTTNAETLAEAA